MNSYLLSAQTILETDFDTPHEPWLLFQFSDFSVAEFFSYRIHVEKSSIRAAWRLPKYDSHFSFWELALDTDDRDKKYVQ